jgi:hypothetical protein
MEYIESLTLFRCNAFVEGSAALVALFFPTLMPMFTSVGKSGRSAVRWWAAAILSLAVVSFFIDSVADAAAKDAVAAGMLVYHVLLALLMLEQPIKFVALGLPVHSIFAFFFARFLFF